MEISASAILELIRLVHSFAQEPTLKTVSRKELETAIQDIELSEYGMIFMPIKP